MNFTSDQLSALRPTSIYSVEFPRRVQFYPSPGSWRNEILYFLLVDRFSDNLESTRPLLNKNKIVAARPNNWSWQKWSQSGGDRWQGGNLAGVISKLDYLKQLGITTIWLSPVFKQRGHLNTYHGYGIQDFLDVDPRFGSREDLVDLVSQAHNRGIRIILDIIFNHSGENWTYPDTLPGGKHRPSYSLGRHDFGAWRGEEGQDIHAIEDSEEGVWPIELQDPDKYTRAGFGNLGAGDINDDQAEHKRTDFITLRDFFLDHPTLLSELADCYKYWIALTDCDGFRIDTLKHVSYEQARNFCGTIKEFAFNIGKTDFFLVGEIAGGDYDQDRYLDVIGRNLNAALDIGGMRLNLNQVAKGLQSPNDYFSGFNPGNAIMGSHRAIGDKHVSVLDDHDHVFGKKLRFSAEAATDHQVVAGVAMQLFTLGIPCIYYGTEQSLGGPEISERKWLADFGSSDKYLRETLFGAEHPLSSGLQGLDNHSKFDTDLPGFGAFGTVGHHCFNSLSPAYVRISHLTKIREKIPALIFGRQYLRPISFLGKPFAVYSEGEIIAWSRILDDEEIVVVLNPHGNENRGAKILVDASLNTENGEFIIVGNTEEIGDVSYAGNNMIGKAIEAHRTSSGIFYIEVNQVGPSEVIVLSNK